MTVAIFRRIYFRRGLLSLADYGDTARVQTVGARHAVPVIQGRCILRDPIGATPMIALTLSALRRGAAGLLAVLLLLAIQPCLLLGQTPATEPGPGPAR